MKIHTLNPVWTQLDTEAADYLRNELSFETIRWEQSFGKPQRVMEKDYLIEGWDPGVYMMLTGYVDRSLRLFKKYGDECDYQCDIDGVGYVTPHINGEEFRPYQLELVTKALEHGYGVIISPTGSGKSYIINGIISAFPDSNILLLVHTLDLVVQLKKGLQDIGFDPGEYTGSKKEFKRITVSTVQSYAKIAHRYSEHWDVVLVDEGHHVSSHNSGNYYKALANCGAPARFAFTATESDSEEQRVGLEGLIGPIIGRLTMEEGHALGFLATPEIIFRPCPLPSTVLSYYKTPGYTTIYRDGIVDNFNRNVRIITEADKEVEAGGIVLILVKQTRHIDNIVEDTTIPMEVVKGAVKKDERLRIKEDLKSGRSKCVIATPAWVEGIDIPNLTMVINAGGGKSEKEVLQKIGRGLRKTENKNTVKLIDFFDVKHTDCDPLGRQPKGAGKKHVLHKQSIVRWNIYVEQGWEPIIR